jgi:hypothetical protein
MAFAMLQIAVMWAVASSDPRLGTLSLLKSWDDLRTAVVRADDAFCTEN